MGADPTLVMADQFVRILVLEALKSAIFFGVALLVYRVSKRLRWV